MKSGLILTACLLVFAAGVNAGQMPANAGNNMELLKPAQVAEGNSIFLKVMPADARTREVTVEVWINNRDAELGPFGFDLNLKSGSMDLLRCEKGALTSNFFAVMGNMVGERKVRIGGIPNPAHGFIPVKSKGCIARLVFAPGTGDAKSSLKANDFEFTKLVDTTKKFKPIVIKKVH